ncbi:MAG: class I SAM-dependent methyltransferase [Balneola sp.]
MIYPKNWKEYELLDHGQGRKLERFGNVILDRPEPSATWAKLLSESEWKNADAVFSESDNQKGSWDKHLPDWNISYPFGETEIRFKLSQGSFKHPGIFPEQADNWEFIKRKCSRFTSVGVQPRVLNLFAYTGGASLAADLSGAEVTHIDSVKSVVTWARENAELNGIDSIRWIVEDAPKFVEKEIKRGNTYHGIIMDPPIFGLGPKGGRWKLNRDLPRLLENAMKLLDTKHRFFILNTYSPQLPLSELPNLVKSTTGFSKKFKSDKLGLVSASGKELALGNLVRF